MPLAAAAAPDAHLLAADPTPDAVAQAGYGIGFYAFSTGGNVIGNSCYRIKGTLGQTAPGYSSGNIYALIAGYWQFTPPASPEEIFYNGFEDC